MNFGISGGNIGFGGRGIGLGWANKSVCQRQNRTVGVGAAWEWGAYGSIGMTPTDREDWEDWEVGGLVGIGFSAGLSWSLWNSRC